MTGKLEKEQPTLDTASYKKPESVVLSERLYQEFKSSRATWEVQAQEDADFRDNAQWSKDDEVDLAKKNQFPLVINVIHPAVENLKAALTANKPRFSSAGREGSDIKVGSMFSNILSYVWDRSLGNMQLKQAIDDYAVRSMGVMVAYTDPYADHGKGEVCFHSVSPMDVFIDPNSKDPLCRDAAHILISDVITHEQFQRLYPTFMQEMGEPLEENPGTNTIASSRMSSEGTGSTNEVNDLSSKKYRRIDRYSRVKVSVYHAYDATSGMEKELGQQEYIDFLKQPAFAEISKNEAPRFITNIAEVRDARILYERTKGTFHFALSQGDMSGEPMLIPGPEDQMSDAQQGLQTIPGSEIQLIQMTMLDMVRMKQVIVNRILVDRIKRVFIVGGRLYFETILPLTDYPVVMLMNRHNRNPYPISDVRFVRHIQEYINKLRSLIIAHASNSTNVKLLVPRGSTDTNKLEQEWQKAGTAVIEFDGELGQPIVAGPVPLPNELYRNEAEARRDIQEIFGIYTLSQGDSSQAPSTYKGTVALDEYGQRRIKSKKDDVEEFLNQLARVMIQLIQNTYTEQKTLRIIRPNNIPFELTINHRTPETVEDQSEEAIKIGDITVGEYDVVVVSGSTLPVNRWARFEYYMELYKDGIIDQVEVLKQTEVADMEGVLRRTSQIKILQQQLAQALDQIKSMKGDMQTLQRENVHANQRVELEKYKTDLNSMSNKAEAATHLFGARLTDQVQNAKTILAAEIKAKKASAKTKKEK